MLSFLAWREGLAPDQATLEIVREAMHSRHSRQRSILCHDQGLVCLAGKDDSSGAKMEVKLERQGGVIRAWTLDFHST